MVALLLICQFLLIVYNTRLVMGFVIRIIKLILGENPLSRLLSILGAIAALGLYGYFSIYKSLEYWNSTDSDGISPIPMILLLVFPLVLLAANYVMNGSGDDDKNSNAK